MPISIFSKTKYFIEVLPKDFWLFVICRIYGLDLELVWFEEKFACNFGCGMADCGIEYGMKLLLHILKLLSYECINKLYQVCMLDTEHDVDEVLTYKI